MFDICGQTSSEMQLYNSLNVMNEIKPSREIEIDELLLKTYYLIISAYDQFNLCIKS